MLLLPHRLLTILILFSLLTAEVIGAESPENLPLKQFSADEIQADFEQLYEELKASHFDLFINLPEPEYRALYEQNRQLLTQTMSHADVANNFQRFLAQGRIAHARIEDQSQAFSEFLTNGGKIIPLGIRVVQGRVYINDLFVANKVLQLGDEILAIEDHAMADLLSQMQKHISADTDYLAHTMMEFEFQRLIWQELGTRPSYKLKVARSTTESFEVKVKALSKEELGKLSETELDQQESVLSLSWSDRSFRLVDQDIAYLRPGPFYNTEGENLWDTTVFSQFIDDSFAKTIKSNSGALIIDLRNNPGGDNSFSDLMLNWFATTPYRFYSQFNVKSSLAAKTSNAARLKLSPDSSVSKQYATSYDQFSPGEIFAFSMPMATPRESERYVGRVFVLINRHSYSNAVTVAATVQDYEFGIVLGEETADLATTLGAMEHFQLKHSRLKVGFPKAEIIRPNGQRQRRGVVPDVLIKTPIVESEDDPVLKQVVRYIRQQSSLNNDNNQ